MYISVRCFFNKCDKLPPANIILSTLERIACFLHLPYDEYYYLLPSPDSDNNVIQKQFPNSEEGRQQLLNCLITPIVVGKYGEESSAFLGISCFCNENEAFEKARIEYQYPQNAMPATLRIDYKQTGNKNFDFCSYCDIISILYDMQLETNNSFVVNLRNKKACVSLDGGQIGSFVTLEIRRNLKNYLLHQEHHFMNSIRGACCANSIEKKYINKYQVSEIRQIVGEKNFAEIGNSVVFALPNLSFLTPQYSIIFATTINKLKQVLNV